MPVRLVEEEPEAHEAKAVEAHRAPLAPQLRSKVGWSPRVFALKLAIFLTAAALVGIVGQEILTGGFAQNSLAKELALARSEGIITSAEDIAAEVKPVPDHLNAGPIAKEMLDMKFRSPNLGTMVWETGVGQDPQGIAKAEELLGQGKGYVALAEEASRREFFSIKRDYSLGSLMPAVEFSSLVRGADMLRLRAGVSHKKGKWKEAADDLRSAERLSALAKQDPMALHFPLQTSERGMLLAASWAWAQPENKIWVQQLEREVKAMEIPTERDLNRLDLAMALEGFDAVQKHGRAALGFKEPPAFTLDAFAKLNPVLQGKIRLVKGFRKAWPVMDQTGPVVEKTMADAEFLFTWGLLSDPTVFQTHGDSSLEKSDQVAEFARRKGLYEAAAHLLHLPREEAKKLRISPVKGVNGRPIQIKWTENGFTLSNSTAYVPLWRETLQVPPTRNQWKQIP